jgi:hypothetical protein
MGKYLRNVKVEGSSWGGGSSYVTFGTLLLRSSTRLELGCSI